MTQEHKNKKVHLDEVEINIAYHCNLTCQGCSHLSPIMDEYFVDANKLFQELKHSIDLISIGTLSLIGGEPLLHPDLDDVVNACVDSGISERVRIVTNGLLLPKIKQKVLNNIDEIYVSLYENPELSQENIKFIHDIAEQNEISLRFARYPQFRQIYSQNPSSNDELTMRVFKTCEVAHHWKCYTLDKGVLYRCPQSLFIPIVQSEVKQEGLSLLDSDITPQHILNFLNSENSLDACKYCLGSAGLLFTHNLVPRKNWADKPTGEYNNLVDFEYLKTLETTGPSKLMRYRTIELEENRG